MSKASLDKWRGKFAFDDPEPSDKFQFTRTRENSMDKTIREANFRATQASRKFKEKLHELDQFGPLRSSLPANLTVMNKHRRLDPISFKDNLAAEHHRLL